MKIATLAGPALALALLLALAAAFATRPAPHPALPDHCYCVTECLEDRQ